MSATMTASPAVQKTTKVAPQRVLSVDLLRGLTIALMILVNDPGDWGHVFRQLDHADWNGWTLTDLVFPTFLFLVGASIVFSLNSRMAKGNCWKTLTGQVFLRTAKILLLQFVLVFFPRMHWTHMRLYGVLPRIALCYCVAGLVMIAVIRRADRVKLLIGVVVVLLVGYWVLLRWVPVPGAGMPVRDFPLLDETRNLTSWVDRAAMHWTQHWLHTGVLYRPGRDPEGLLSTLPAVATTLLGSLAALWMRTATSGAKALLRVDGSVRAEARTYHKDSLAVGRGGVARGARSMLRMQGWLAAAGVAGVAAGSLWAVWLPINKNLWTSSYVLLSAGWAALALAGLSWLVDGRDEPWPGWLRVSTWPWFVFGSNAIAAFTVSVVLVKGCLYFRVTDGDDRVPVWEWMYNHWFARVDSTNWTSLAFAVAVVAFCFLPNWWLWRRKWFLKV